MFTWRVSFATPIAMNTDRRIFERAFLTGKVTLHRGVSSSGVLQIPFYLRDVSKGGISGAYFGDVDSLMRNEVFVRDQDETVHPVRLVWFSKTVDLIYVIGLKFRSSLVDTGSWQFRLV